MVTVRQKRGGYVKPFAEGTAHRCSANGNCWPVGVEMRRRTVAMMMGMMEPRGPHAFRTLHAFLTSDQCQA